MTADFGEILCDIIATYGGRDKVMKILCYTAKVLATPNHVIRPDNAKKFYIFSSKVSQARATLRLIDDLPTIRYAIAYGLGRNEKNAFDAFLGVLTNIVDVLYFPVDKVCWMADHKIMQLDNPRRWEVINSTFWSLSVFLNLMRILRDYHDKHIVGAVAKGASASAEERKKYEQQWVMETITVVRLSLDLVHAASTLPKGCLWGGNLQSWQVGLIGTMSGLLGFYQYVTKVKKTKK